MSELAVADEHGQTLVDSEKLVTMKINNQMFGVPILQVQDIVEPRMITPVPLAPSSIAGVMNLRGRIVTVINLRRCLGLEDRSEKQRSMGITVEYRGDLYTMLVDEIGDVCDLPKRDFENPPATLEENLRQLCTGVFRLEGDLLVALDVDRVLDTELLMKSPPIKLKQRSAATSVKSARKPSKPEPEAKAEEDSAGETEEDNVVPFGKNGPAAEAENPAAPIEQPNEGPEQEELSLFDRLGGDGAVEVATDILYGKVMSDASLKAIFDGVDMDKQSFMMRVFLTGAFGGPQAYTGPSLRAAHEKLVNEKGLTETHFTAFVGHLQATLDELGVTPDLIGEVMEIVAAQKDDVLSL